MNIVDRPIGEDDLQAYVDGRLNEERRAAVDAYLNTQPAIAQRVSDYAAQRDTLRGALQARYDAPIPAHLRVDAIAERMRRPRWQLPLGATAAMLLAAGGLAGWSTRGYIADRDGASLALASAARPMEDALIAHRVFVADIKHPIEVGADQQAHLQMWLSKRVGRKLIAPDLSAAGYRLLGGRLLAAASGPAALFMYERAGGDRITVYVRHSVHRDQAPLGVTEEAGLSAAYWYDGGYGFAVAGDTGRAATLKLAASAQRQLAI